MRDNAESRRAFRREMRRRANAYHDLAALAFPCTTCKSEAGDACIVRTDGRLRDPHAARMQAAREWVKRG